MGNVVIYRVIGVFIIACAASATAVYVILSSRKPDMKKPGIGHFLSLSGMSMIGIGLMLHGNPVAPFISTLGVIEYIVGLGIYIVQRSKSNR